jgi:CHAD domain-containing protein
MSLDRKRAHKPIRKLRKLLKRMPKVPTAEQVHQLRTNTRRFEAMVSALKLDKGGKRRRMLKDLAGVRKRAGKVRDMDVLIGYTAALGESHDEENCRIQLLEFLGAKRKTQAKKLRATVAKRAKKTRGALKRISTKLEAVLCENKDNDCDNSVAPSKATAKALEFESDLVNPKQLNRSNLHSYRLKVKQLQNVLRLGENGDGREFVDTLGSVKDAIGEWHDWEELLGIARDVLDHGANCGILRAVKHNCELKYGSAMAEAEKMRQHYLGKRKKSNGKVELSNKKVWAATTAIAA